MKKPNPFPLVLLALLKLSQPLAAQTGGMTNLTGLLGYWRMNETTGDVVTDSSGYGNHGKIINSSVDSWVTDAVRGKVYQATGTNVIDFGAILPAWSTTNDFTWSLWVNSSADASSTSIVLGDRYKDISAAGLGTDYSPREYMRFTPRRFEWYIDRITVADNDGVLPSTWTHHLVTKNGTSLNYSINGVWVRIVLISGQFANRHALYLGGQGTLFRWKGRADEVAIFNRALSLAEVQEVYDLGKAGAALMPGLAPELVHEPAAPIVHQISGITALSNRNVSLSLTGRVEAIFSQYFDQYVLEASSNLRDWMPLVTLQQPNQSTTALTYQDKAAGQFERRFYRAFTNHLITPLPQPTGPYAVGTFSRLLTDPSRTNTDRRTNHQFMVTFWYPAVARAGVLPTSYVDWQLAQTTWPLYGGFRVLLPRFFSHSLSNAPLATDQIRYPVVLYSPSLNSHRKENIDKTEELASQGYIVVGLDHLDTFLSVFPDGTAVTGRGLNNTTELAGIRDRAQDERFVLDELARLNESDPLLRGRLDLEKIGAFGWSLGGATAAEFCRVDPRCRAGVNMDGSFVIPEVVQQGLARPFMILHGDYPDSVEAMDDQKKVYERLVAQAYWVKLTNTVHTSFGEAALLFDSLSFQTRFGAPPPDRQTSGVRTSQISRAYLVSFFNKHLKNQDDHLLDGPSAAFPEVMEFLKK